MKIVIIGTGNVATVLGRKLKDAGHQVVQVFGRNAENALSLANELGAGSCSAWESIIKNADLYLLAVSDKALEEARKYLILTDQIVVHTAGAMPMELLKYISSNYGILYPFQSLRKEVEPTTDIPLFIDGNNEEVKQKLIGLAKTLSPIVREAEDGQRLKYHLCGTVVNNFSNYLYVLTERYCQTNQLEFGNLFPLIQETTNRLQRFSPREVQTGPGARKDFPTIEKHLALLENEPELYNLYRMVSEKIVQFLWQ